jgi:hypothetical protein
MKFLRPEKTFEDSTESFQDFIISLDKDKADKLRYKVEGDLVKIFITPYHTTISPADLKFETGDLNVDLIIALGVKEQGDIDKAALAHGKILHSAPIITINAGIESSLGSINAKIADESGYSETISKLIMGLDEKLLSKQISTALLTGIVLETEQFSNSKTTPDTMTVASKLLSSGADQQLIVKEIRGTGNVAETPANVAQEIPEVETVAAGAAPAIVEPKPTPVPEPEPEPIQTLDEFMPPPLTGLTGELPPPPDVTAPEFDESIPAFQPAPQPEPVISEADMISGSSESLPPPPEDLPDSIPAPPDLDAVVPEPTQELTPEPSESISTPPVEKVETVEITDTSTPDPTQFHIPV